MAERLIAQEAGAARFTVGCTRHSLATRWSVDPKGVPRSLEWVMNGWITAVMSMVDGVFCS
jgi:hypothetical protein